MIWRSGAGPPAVHTAFFTATIPSIAVPLLHTADFGRLLHEPGQSLVWDALTTWVCLVPLVGPHLFLLSEVKSFTHIPGGVVSAGRHFPYLQASGPAHTPPGAGAGRWGALPPSR